MSPRKTLSADKRKGYSKKKVSDFSRNLQARRLELGLSQAQLANILEVSRPRISQIEGGIFPSDPERIIAIADALGVTLDWLFGRKK